MKCIQGHNFVQEIGNLKGLSTGKIFKLGKCHMDETVFQAVKDNAVKKDNELKQTQAKRTPTSLGKF